MSQSMEIFHAAMESTRNEAEDAYFGARYQLNSIPNRTLYRAGYERGFQQHWDELTTLRALRDEMAQMPCENRIERLGPGCERIRSADCGTCLRCRARKSKEFSR